MKRFEITTRNGTRVTAYGEIKHRHEGFITVETDDGEGASVSIDFIECWTEHSIGD